MSKIFEPGYKVTLNRITGERFVQVTTRKGNETHNLVVQIYPVVRGSRTYYTHYCAGAGRQSALFPTLRDCIFDIVYR